MRFWNRYTSYSRRWLTNLQSYLRSVQHSNIVDNKTNFSSCKRPVLLLYGFGATRRSVSFLEERLRSDGYDVFSLRLGGLLGRFNTHRIDRIANYVAERIESLCQKYDLPKLAIIGHSKGGLIGRYYLTKLNGDRRIHTLITLATPHQGTKLSWFGIFSRGLRQMHPRSKLIRELNMLAFPKSVFVASLYSDADKIAPPKVSQLTANDENIMNVVLPKLKHTDFVIRPSAYQEMRKLLERRFET